MNILDRFVAARYWLAPAFILVYYLQLCLPSRFVMTKHASLGVLMFVMLVAVIANFRWIPDYAARLNSGVFFLKEEKDSTRDEKQMLEQMRWANAKILAIIAMILALLTHYEKLEEVAYPHKVPVMVVLLLILVALFDSALDLEAEWTISVLSVSNSIGTAPKMHLAHAIWNTNQFRTAQRRLYENLVRGHYPEVTFRAFSSTAQNMISFAIIVVGGTAALTLRFLYQQW